MKTYQLSVPIYVELTTEAENVSEAMWKFLQHNYKIIAGEDIEHELKDNCAVSHALRYIENGDSFFLCVPGIIVDGDDYESLAEAIEFEKEEDK